MKNQLYLPRCRKLINIICGSHSFNNGIRYQRTTICNICETYESDSLAHMLFRCPSLDNERRYYFEELLSTMPPPMQKNYTCANNDQKIIMLLSGFNSSYIPEWNSLFCNIIRTITELYTVREQKQEEYDIKMQSTCA